MAITSERGKRKSVDLELSATHTVWWLLMPKGYFVFLQLNKQIKLAKRTLYYLRIRSANVG
ncbi:MAG: hypothetical protein IM531_00725 [Pseudanabaena sp. M090S1SP1A06QC]|nr:hypothetical protein [Pseudanabaena sp. M109S1SP1A06QC]MCA6613234.1 hypothetical protein [Pseudanabaena sp. M090S1SP1A06QC]